LPPIIFIAALASSAIAGCDGIAFNITKDFVPAKLQILCAGHGKEVEDESSLQADLKRSASLDKVILVRE